MRLLVAQAAPGRCHAEFNDSDQFMSLPVTLTAEDGLFFLKDKSVHDYLTFKWLIFATVSTVASTSAEPGTAALRMRAPNKWPLAHFLSPQQLLSFPTVPPQSPTVPTVRGRSEALISGAHQCLFHCPFLVLCLQFSRPECPMHYIHLKARRPESLHCEHSTEMVASVDAPFN